MKNKLALLIMGVCSIHIACAANNKCEVNKPVVEMNIVTNGKQLGVIDIQLNKNKAPQTVANFIHYVNSGFYNGKIFHRVIPGFMIQGGGFDKNMIQAQTMAPIKNEANNGLTNNTYTIAMARTQDPNSATSQFFINVNDNNSLNYAADNPGYAVFGQVIKGDSVVDSIASVATGNVGMYQNVPNIPVIIKSAQLICK